MPTTTQHETVRGRLAFEHVASVGFGQTEQRREIGRALAEGTIPGDVDPNAPTEEILAALRALREQK